MQIGRRLVSGRVGPRSRSLGGRPVARRRQQGGTGQSAFVLAAVGQGIARVGGRTEKDSGNDDHQIDESYKNQEKVVVIVQKESGISTTRNNSRHGRNLLE